MLLKESSILFLLVIIKLCVGEIANVKYTGDCNSLLQNFANSAADFMLCAISNARPIRMCSSCVGSYSAVIEDHTKILEISQSDNITCKDRLINFDRLEIIEAGFMYVTDLWERGRCPNCFSDGTINLSNETREFQRLYSEIDSCLEINFNQDNNSFNEGVCKNCSNAYQRMSSFYNHLTHRLGDGNVCMDIVDSMNITQNLWSGTLHCGEEIMMAEAALIASCAAVLSLPIIFYLVAWKLSLTSPALVSQQKRLSTRFMEKWRSRTGSMISNLRNS